MKRTAQSAYDEHREAIDNLLQKIARGLERKDSAQEKDPRNWGFVGTVADYRNALQEVSDSLWHEGEYAEGK